MPRHDRTVPLVLPASGEKVPPTQPPASLLALSLRLAIVRRIYMSTAPATASPYLEETTSMVVWPGITRFWLGRLFGQWYDIKAGAYIFTVGNLAALLTAPGGAKMYLLRVAPGVAIRYRLTNRRIIVEHFYSGKEERAVELDRFDTIDVVRRPGMRWFDHGDLVFKLGQMETFRLEAVPRPHAVKAALWKAHMAYSGVKRVLAKQAALA